MSSLHRDKTLTLSLFLLEDPCPHETNYMHLLIYLMMLGADDV
jgi:hypothetical protein